MTKRRNMNQIIEDSIKEGYVLLAEGTGTYDEEVKKYREEGYDVRYWYTARGPVANRKYVIYGMMKSRKPRQRKVEVDYASMTVKELRKICSAKKIPKYSKMSKEEIIQKLKEVG